VANDPENPDWRKTLWIFRYYDPEGPPRNEDRPSMEEYAADLAIFLYRVRRARGDPADFAVNPVAHGMGGLVCRCYPRNPGIVPTVVPKRLAANPVGYGDITAAAAAAPVTATDVNKFFTYATPHGGMTFRRGLGWAETVRDLFGFADSDVFGKARMREYLPVELNATIRGLPDYLHTRTARDLGAITLPMQQTDTGWAPLEDRIHLYTGYPRTRNRLRTERGRDNHARGVLELRIKPHYHYDGWIRDSRYEGEWIMNHRIHFGLRRTRVGNAAMEYGWNTARRNTPVEALDGQLEVDFPTEVRRDLQGGELDIMFDTWS
jgi:hypothetical protein